MMKRPTTAVVGLVILFCHCSPSLVVAPDEQLDGSRWTLVAPSSTLLPSSELPAAFNRSENNISPVGAASYLNDAQSALLQTNKFLSNFLIDGPSWVGWTLPYVVPVNNVPTFGMILSFPNFFPGATDEEDGRLKWYGNAVNKDLIMNATELLSSDAMTGMFLGSSAKGDMQLLRGSHWTFVEPLPTLDWVSQVSEIPSVTEMDDLGAFCADQVEAGLAFYNSSTNGKPLVYATRLESNVKSASGVWRTVLYMSYTVVQKHLASEEMPSSGVDFGLRRAWALYWAATRPDCALYCSHDETTIPAALTPTPAPVVASGTYLDSPAIIPGTVEVFRVNEDVDIKPTPTSGFYVGWTAGGENLRYTVDVQIHGPRTRVMSTMGTLSTTLLMACLTEYIIHRLLRHRRPTATLPRETELREADLQAGLDRHEKVGPAKQKRMKATKRGTGVETGYRKNTMTWKEDTRMERKLRAEAYAHEKLIKAEQEALERQTLQREYKAKLAERRRDVREEKERKKQELVDRRADVYEERERRVRDRALAAVARRTEAKMVF